MIHNKKINILSNLNFVLLISGYAFFTTLIYPIVGNIQSSSVFITIPYRIVILIISTLLILFSCKKKFIFTTNVNLIFLYFFFHLVRFFVDFELRDNYFNLNTKLFYYIFLIFVSFLPFFSFVITIKYIDFRKVALYSLIMIFITMLSSLVLNLGEQESDRLSGNLGLNPISYGQIGAYSIILSFFFLLSEQRKSIFFIIFLITSIILGFSVIGRAASRGPLFALILCLLFFLWSKQKSSIISILLISILVLSIFIFQDDLVNLISNVSPTLATRILFSINDGDSSGRDELFQAGWQQFLDNRILGSYFVLFPENGKGINSHNIFIDAFMSFGFIGGILIIFLVLKSLFIASKFIRNSDLSWISLFLIISVTSAMVSNSFYMDCLLQLFMATLFIKNKKGYYS